MKRKPLALGLLALVSFASPIAERWITGRVEEMSPFDIGATIASIALIFWWYHQDKAERGYRAGPLMNGGILALAIVAFPIYFVRSRGWKKGLLATVLAAAVLAIYLGLGELGDRLGEALEAAQPRDTGIHGVSGKNGGVSAGIAGGGVRRMALLISTEKDRQEWRRLSREAASAAQCISPSAGSRPAWAIAIATRAGPGRPGRSTPSRYGSPRRSR